MNWYAIYTKSKAEDMTAGLLESAGFEILNPKIRARKYFRNRYTTVIEPLFPCYIFSFFDPARHAHMVRYTRGVRYIVGKENPIAVRKEIIDSLTRAMEDGVITPPSGDFVKGDRVRIKDGPFRDFYGIFERNLRGKERAMILLDVLYCRIEMDSHAMERCSTRG